MQFALTLAADINSGCKDAPAAPIVAVIERDALLPEMLGLMLAKAKTILSGLQAAIITNQIAAHGQGHARVRHAGRRGA